MSKQRDAGTGLYISEEEAKTKPANTWVEETDNKQKFLRELYNNVMAYAGYSECEDFESVQVRWITQVFREAGLEINE